MGNVRVVLGTQTDTSVYAATMETAASEKENALFSNIDNTRQPLPTGYTSAGATNPGAFVSRLNAENGQKVGPSLVLRVMAGDTIQIGAEAFYTDPGASVSNTSAENMAIAIISAFSGGSIVEAAHAATGAASAISTFTTDQYNALKSVNSNENLSDKPKAYLNYALFDDRFNMVNENSGIKQVQGSPGGVQQLGFGKTVMKKSGFLYIYTSNESAKDVYFDNLIVVHNAGPLLEETHYYPFGLTMAGISVKALKEESYTENRKKFNGIEHTIDLDLNQYDAFYRNLDPQIGRWWQIDPKIDSMVAWSTYASMFDNPIRFLDPLGDSSKPNDNQQGYKPAPKTGLPGFPDAGKGQFNSKSRRWRWQLPGGGILEWDKQHGEIEKFDKTGKKHQGAFDPSTGEQVKGPDPGRTTPKIVAQEQRASELTANDSNPIEAPKAEAMVKTGAVCSNGRCSGTNSYIIK